jgi:uncharacterized membrane protein YkvA (DUF1232 family)
MSQSGNFEVSEESLLSFLARNAKSAGKEIVEHALKIWFAINSPSTPLAIKAPLLGALAYLGLPLDVIPDVVPFVGFSDDAAVLVGAIVLAHTYITDDIKAQAQEARRRIVG